MKSADALKKDWGMFLSENTIGPILPGEMTSEIMAGETGNSAAVCQRKLLKLYKHGKATRRRIILNGALGWAYRLK